MCGDRFGPDVRVDQVVGNEEVPFLGQRAESFGPELDCLIAAGDEVLASFVGLQPEGAQAIGGRLLGRDVGPDAKCPLLPLFGRLDDDRRRDAIGADGDLGVLIGRGQRDMGLDERPPPRSHAEGGFQVDHIRDLAQVRKLGPNLQGHARQTVHDDLDQLSHGLRDSRRPEKS